MRFDPLCPALRESLDVSRAAVSLHTTCTAIGAILVGIFGERIIRALGRRTSFWASAAGISAGAVVLASGHDLQITLTGALLFGFSGALSQHSCNRRLPTITALAAAAIVESNALAKSLGAAAPFIVALAILAGGDWRVVFYGGALVAIPAVAFAPLGDVSAGAGYVRDERAASLPPGTGCSGRRCCSSSQWSSASRSGRRTTSRASEASASRPQQRRRACCRGDDDRTRRRRLARETFSHRALADNGARRCRCRLRGVLARRRSSADAGRASPSPASISLLYLLTLALAIEASGGRTDAATRAPHSLRNRDRGGAVRARCRRRPGRPRRRLCDRAGCFGGRGPPCCSQRDHAARSFSFQFGSSLPQFADAFFGLRMRDEHRRESALVERVHDVERLRRGLLSNSTGPCSPARAEAMCRRLPVRRSAAPPRSGRRRTHASAKAEGEPTLPQAGRSRT